MSVINRNSGSAVYDTFAIALTKNMRVGQVCIVKGHITANDGLGAQYGVEANGSGGIEMNNGNELVILDGETLKPASVANISGLEGVDGQQISLLGWHPDSDVGGGTLYWDAAALKSTHNGGTIFSPTVPWTTTTVDYLNAVGETDPSGTGCWVRASDMVGPSDFGGKIDGSLSDNSLQSAVTALQGSRAYLLDGEHNYSVFPTGIDGVKIEGSSRISWTDVKLPVFDSVFTGGLEVALISGVVRYYTSGASGAGWYFLVNQGSNHDPILLEPVTASGSSSIVLKLNIDDFGLDESLWTPSGVVAGADESYAKQGVVVGASASTNDITLEASCTFNEPIYIAYDGAAWNQPTGYTVTWETNRVRIVRDSNIRRVGVSSSRNRISVTPAVRTSGTQIVNMPVLEVDADTMEVFFFDAAGTQVGTESQNMRFYMTDHYSIPWEFSWGASSELSTGNIWVSGTFVRKPASL